MPPSLPLPLSDSASPGCVCAGTFPMWLKGGEAQRTEGLGWRGGGEGLAFRRVCLKDRALLGFPEMRQRRGVKANGLAPLCRQSWVWTLARVANGCGSYLSASESRGEREGERERDSGNGWPGEAEMGRGVLLWAGGLFPLPRQNERLVSESQIGVPLFQALSGGWPSPLWPVTRDLQGPSRMHSQLLHSSASRSASLMQAAAQRSVQSRNWCGRRMRAPEDPP